MMAESEGHTALCATLRPRGDARLSLHELTAVTAIHIVCICVSIH